MGNLIKQYGLSTYHGTNVVAVLLASMEYAKTFDQDTQKWLLPTLWVLLIITFWLIRGNTAPDIADELNGIGHEEIQDVLKQGRE
jgi:cytosine/uracil/thiamine/allantoin permease